MDETTSDATTGLTPEVSSAPLPTDPDLDPDVPDSVRIEEAYLDAVVSHVDDDTADLVELHERVTRLYDES